MRPTFCLLSRGYGSGRGVLLWLNLLHYRSCITVAFFVTGVLSVGERIKWSQRQPPKLFIMRFERRQRPVFTAGCR